jgi:sugar phosphate isomerase/epimerase
VIAIAGRAVPEKRLLSISTVAFDGYSLPAAFEQIARIGAGHVEVAYIPGYMDPFTEEVFEPARARGLAAQLRQAGLSCAALSAHMDLSRAGAVEIFRRRLEFASELGAGLVVANAGPPSRERALLRNVGPLAARAADLGLTLALENPGNGRRNLLDTGALGARLVERLGLPNVGLNYDFGNLLTHLRGQVRPEEDFPAALPRTVHLHVKDAARQGPWWVFPEVGQGAVDYRRILSDPRIRDLPISLEIPLRLRRRPSGFPCRSAQPLGIEQIAEVLRGSLAFVQSLLS